MCADKQAKRCPHGVSLVEVLVVLGMLAVVMSIVLPALSSAREAALRTASLSNLRQLCTVFHVYATEWDDSLPAFMYPGATQTVLRGSFGELRAPYFYATHVWIYALSSRYFDDNLRSEVFFSPLAPQRRAIGVTPYYYTSTALADPKYWAYKTRMGQSQWRRCRMAEVRSPSHKALFWEANWGHPEWTTSGEQLSHPETILQFGMMDGSAQLVKWKNVAPQYIHGDGGSFSGTGLPGMHTINGLHGRDIE